MHEDLGSLKQNLEARDRIRCSSEESSLVPRTHIKQRQLSVTRMSGDPVPSSGFLEHSYMYMEPAGLG